MKAGLKFIIIIALPFLMASCINTDMPECPPEDTGIALKFRYPSGSDTRNEENNPKVDRLSVFIFDNNGLFVSQVNDSLIQINDNYILELPYKQGSYQFVTWAGYDETTYGITSCISGQTHIEDFFLYLKRETDNRIVNQPKLLFHGMHNTIMLNNHEKKIVWIDLKQITNHIRVIAHNLDSEKSHKIYIKDNNGKYGYSSQFEDDDPITYLPEYVNATKESDPLIADFNVMKLDKNREPHLQIVDETNIIRYDENLISKLLGENPNIDFEYNHDFTIEISFNHYVPVSIKINGWEIHENDENQLVYTTQPPLSIPNHI